MKMKYLKVFISVFIAVSFIMTGCAKDYSMGGDPPGVASAYLYIDTGRITKIVEKNLVLVTIIEDGNGFQRGDSLAIKYDVSLESSIGLDDLEGFEEKPMEVQVGDIVFIQYGKNARKKRDIGEIKDCNYVRTCYLYVILKERYESMHSDDAD